MRTKITFLAGFGAGYVLGARAGRARYEQIRQAARSFMANPTVQSTAASLQHQAGDAVGGALSTAKDKAVDKLGDRAPSWLASSQQAAPHATNGSSVGGANGTGGTGTGRA